MYTLNPYDYRIGQMFFPQIASLLGGDPFMPFPPEAQQPQFPFYGPVMHQQWLQLLPKHLQQQSVPIPAPQYPFAPSPTAFQPYWPVPTPTPTAHLPHHPRPY
jgi:hypothetical protein